MRSRRFLRHGLVAASAALLACTVGLIDSSLVHADTTPGVITGEGGDAMLPVVQSLINADSAQLTPDFASYTNVDVDSAISDFIGTGPGEFGADFVVSERSLTPDETATATANGRTFAYVPFAATPVALMTLVPNTSFNSTTIGPTQFCRNIPLTLDQLDGIYGSLAPQLQYSSWADSRLTSPDTCDATPQAIAKWGNLDPTMENEALENLLDSTTASQASFAAGLTADGQGASTTDPTATEAWPFPQTTIVGGDQAVLGKLIDLNQTTGAPGNVAADMGLGAILPVASDWTGAPLGVTWNLPTAAVQNAQGAFVAPSAASAAAAENDAVLASTSDPTTNNLVTFPASAAATDPAAYNNFLMLQSYLVVPTNGLSSDKALGLAQLIRSFLGTTGQKDIASFGAAPATPAMVTAGLKIAQQLDTEAAVEASSDSTTTTVCTSTTTTTSTPTSSTTTTAPTSTTTSTAPTSTTTSTAPTSTTTTTTTSPSSTTTTVPCTGTSTTTTSPDCTTTTSSSPTTTVPTSTSTTASTSTTTSTTPSSTTTTTSPDCTTSTTTTTTTTIPGCSTSPSTSSTTSTTAPSTTTTTAPTSTTSTTTAPATTTTTSPTTTTTTSPTTTTTASTSTTTTTDPTSTTTTTDPSTTTTTAPTSTTTTAPPSTTTTAPSSTTTTAPSGTTTTTTCPTSTTTTAAGSGPGGSDGGVTTGASTGTGSSDNLAFTGTNPVPLVVLGFLLFLLGEFGLRLMRKRALNQ